MATDNEWLRLIYAQLSQASSAPGGSSITQAEVKAAIESAANVDQLEPKLDTLATVLDAVLANTASLVQKSAWASKLVTSASAEYAASSSGFDFTVPAGKEWQFQSAYIPYVAGGAALNRVMRFQALSAAGTFLAVSASRVTQTAGQSYYYNAGLYPSLDAAIASYIYLPFPPLILSAGEKIGISVPGLPSGDTFSNFGFKVMERSA